MILEPKAPAGAIAGGAAYLNPATWLVDDDVGTRKLVAVQQALVQVGIACEKQEWSLLFDPDNASASFTYLMKEHIIVEGGKFTVYTVGKRSKLTLEVPEDSAFHRILLSDLRGQIEIGRHAVRRSIKDRLGVNTTSHTY